MKIERLHFGLHFACFSSRCGISSQELVHAEGHVIRKRPHHQALQAGEGQVLRAGYDVRAALQR